MSFVDRDPEAEPTATVDRLLARLDADQRAVVTAAEPLCCVIAGAGSGKTTTLTTRIAYRVATGAIDDSHAVAITFTRQAAGELRRRLATMLDERVRVSASTFHALSLGLLREHWALQRRPPRSLLRSRLALVSELVGNRSVNAHVVAGEIDWASARGIAAPDYEREASAARRLPGVSLSVIADVMQQYQRQKQRRGVLDYDDLLVECVTALTEHTEFGTAIRWRYRHLFVDEFQDINTLQFRLLEALRGHRPDLTIVGDPNQAIYAWNGAVPAFLDEVERTFPGVRVLRLERNYRCAPAILDAATAVLRAGGLEPTSRAFRRHHGMVAWRSAADERGEAAVVAAAVRAALGPGRRPSRVAVLARTNAQLGVLADSLRRDGIPVTLTGTAAARPSANLGEELRSEVLALRSRDAMAAWAADVRHEVGRDPAGDDDSIDASTPSRSPRADVATAMAVFTRVPEGGGPADGAAFLSWFDANADPADAGGVELLTFHASKGREWPSVVICGAESGLIPHWSAGTPAQAAEEVRLAYVAMTRAADELTFTWADQRDGRATGRSSLFDEANALGTAVDGTGRPSRPDRPQRATRPMSATDHRAQALREWRATVARAAAVDPRAVVDDDLLDDIAAGDPHDLASLADIRGIGASTLDRHGHRILSVLERCRTR